jgi:hypothetical protein
VLFLFSKVSLPEQKSVVFSSSKVIKILSKNCSFYRKVQQHKCLVCACVLQLWRRDVLKVVAKTSLKKTTSSKIHRISMKQWSPDNSSTMYGGGGGGGNAWMKIMGIGGDQVQKRQAQKGKKDVDGKPCG